MSAPLIICFGDSLTAGYQSPPDGSTEAISTPYGRFLQERLGSAATFMITGICGELTRGMVARFHRDVVAFRPQYVVLLGGTNDLGWHVPHAEIVGNLQTMYRAARDAGVVPIAVTVPSIRAEISGTEGADWVRDHIARRHLLNRAITAYCVEEDMACVDLFTATAEPGTGVLASPYSNDGLHLTTAGYRKLADLLYEQIFAGFAR